ncbi:MFS transporter [Nakamurella lactea]|uniref:MFS transporter n=1 Tax=Nakamurella lactea TaxID=459515 RepID=UPI0004223D9E|nr:MFS transporter [Nakamurella lactea]
MIEERAGDERALPMAGMTKSGPDGVRRGPLIALSSAYLISVLGSSMAAIAIPWLVLTTTGSAGRTGLVLFVQMTPYVLAQAVGGPWVDRVGPHRTFWSGNLLAALFTGAIPLLYSVGDLSLVVLAVLAGAAGAARGLADCGNTVLVPGVARIAGVSVERVSGLNSAANRTGLLLGAPLGGVLLGLLNPASVVLIDAVTFLIAAVLVGLLVPIAAQHGPAPAAPPVPVAAAPPPERYLTKLRVGFAFLRRDRLLLGLCMMIAVTNLSSAALGDVLVPTWVLDRGHLPSALGVVGGALALGSIGGNLLGGWIGDRVRRWVTFSFGFLLGGAPLFFVLAGTDSVLLAGIVAALSGLLTGSLNPILGGIWYRRIPHDMLARVIGVVRASGWIGVPFGPLLGGTIAQAWGVDTALWVFGGLTLLATLAPFAFPVFKEMDPPQDEPTPGRTAEPAPGG